MNRILSLVKPRVLSIVLIVLGLLAVILAVASATIWRPSQTAVATLKPAATTAYVVTGDGVLNMVDSTVTITAKAKDANSTVTLALARSEDAQAWLANDPYTEVTGLSSWEALSGRTITERCNVKAAPTATATSTAKATAKATSTAKATATSTAKATPTPDAKGCIKAVASNASLNGSDMWVTSKTGKGSVSITYDPSSSNYVVLAATDGKQAAPTFSLSWKRTVGTPWLIPGLIVGGLLVAGGVFIFMLDIQMRHQELANAQRRRRRQEEAAARLNKDPNRPLTRLELREKAQAEAAGKVWIDPRRDVPSESAADVDADRTIPAAPNPITDSRGIWAVQAAGGADRVAAAQDQVAPQEGLVLRLMPLRLLAPRLWVVVPRLWELTPLEPPLRRLQPRLLDKVPSAPPAPRRLRLGLFLGLAPPAQRKPARLLRPAALIRPKPALRQLKNLPSAPPALRTRQLTPSQCSQALTPLGLSTPVSLMSQPRPPAPLRLLVMPPWQWSAQVLQRTYLSPLTSQ